MFKGRPVIEIMILSFTMVVVFVMMIMATVIIIVEIMSEGTANTDRAVDALMSLVSGILGALLGLIAGKSTVNGEGTTIAQLPPGATVTKTTTIAPSETPTVIEETKP